MSSHLSKEHTSTRKTVYHIAHPAPVVLPKVNRPKLLLQLQELSDATRPTPAFEVVPSALLAPKLLRNSSRIVRGKTGYGLEDLIVFHAEDYRRPCSSSPGATQNHEDEEAPRIVLGAICHNILNQQNNVAPTITDTEIHLADGSQFSASRPSASYYEFTLLTPDGTSTKARWICRAGRQRFTFTLPLPDSTQHPKVGTLTSSNLTIFSTYKIPPEGRVVDTSTLLFSLAVVSSIWVAFMEGWSALLSPDAGKNNLLSLCRRGSTNSLMSGHTYNSSAGSLTRSITLQNPWVLGKQARFSSPTKQSARDHHRSVSDGSYFIPPSPATKPIELAESPPRESYDTAPESNDEEVAEIDDLDGNVDAGIDAEDDDDAIASDDRSGEHTSLDVPSRSHRAEALKTLSHATTEEVQLKAETQNDNRRGSRNFAKRFLKKLVGALKRSTGALIWRRRRGPGNARAIGVHFGENRTV